MTTIFNINLSAEAPTFNITLADAVSFSVATATTGQVLAHKNTHGIGGTDRLIPSDIGAQSLFSISGVAWSTSTTDDPQTLLASRATRCVVQVYKAGNFELILPTTAVQAGDIIELRTAGPWNNNATVTVKQQHSGFQSTLLVLKSGDSYRLENQNGTASSWGVHNPHTHTHASSQISDFTSAVTAIVNAIRPV